MAAILNIPPYPPNVLMLVQPTAAVAPLVNGFRNEQARVNALTALLRDLDNSREAGGRYQDRYQRDAKLLKTNKNNQNFRLVCQIPIMPVPLRLTFAEGPTEAGPGGSEHHRRQLGDVSRRTLHLVTFI